MCNRRTHGRKAASALGISVRMQTTEQRAAETAGERRTTALKRLIRSPDLSFLMEAHSGLSAKIAEEAGFQGLWASGLSISASLGLRDANGD